MHKVKMGIPGCACGSAGPERMVFLQTEVIRSPFIHEVELARWKGVKGIRWNHFESGLQLFFEREAFLRTLAVLDLPAGAHRNFIHRKTQLFRRRKRLRGVFSACAPVNGYSGTLG